LASKIPSADCHSSFEMSELPIASAILFVLVYPVKVGHVLAL
jgi:hypothetical protein